MYHDRNEAFYIHSNLFQEVDHAAGLVGGGLVSLLVQLEGGGRGGQAVRRSHEYPWGGQAGLARWRTLEVTLPRHRGLVLGHPGVVTRHGVVGLGQDPAV